MKALIPPAFTRRRTFRSWKRGQTLVEYALIMVILTIVAVAIYGLLDKQIENIFSKIDIIIDTAQSSD